MTDKKRLAKPSQVTSFVKASNKPYLYDCILHVHHIEVNFSFSRLLPERRIVSQQHSIEKVT